ncbi:MAG: response regulator [Vicinamibacterales bacterium]
MILAAVDDLMFASKISAAAKRLGVEVIFARSSDEVLRQVRALRPRLAIFDLNSTRTEPLATISAIKGDADLVGVRTIAFVSHVQAELIEDARRSGVDEVLARSAFSAKLGEILQSGG